MKKLYLILHIYQNSYVILLRDKAGKVYSFFNFKKECPIKSDENGIYIEIEERKENENYNQSQ